MSYLNDEERNLSVCETYIMKILWDANEDISVPELTKRLKERYGKDYQRSTVVTFLLKLYEKGFAKTYRDGRLSYIHVLKSEEEYKKRRLNEEKNFWYKGSAANLVASLAADGGISKEEIEKIRGILDELDD